LQNSLINSLIVVGTTEYLHHQ